MLPWSVSSSRVCSLRPSVSWLWLWKRWWSTTSCLLPPLTLLGPNMGDAPRQSAPFIWPSHRLVYGAPPHGRVGRSCRQMERLVLVPDGVQRERAHVCLVGSIKTLLQPSGIAAVRGGKSYFWNCSQVILRLAQALADCVKDLLRPFHDDPIDLVAGIDAMGFILGKLDF